MATWKEVNAALQAWFADDAPTKPELKPTLASVLADYFKGGKK